MNELALFAGAGGGILGGKLLGWNTICAVERDAYAAQVLCQRQNDGTFATFPIWSDVTSFDGTKWRGLVDVVSGGFPCQDISSARTNNGGKQLGLEGKKSGLWFEFLRIIDEVRPTYAYIENSKNLRTKGLITVLEGLAEIGYDAAWTTCSAKSFGANHERDRMWILAYSDGTQCTRRCLSGGGQTAHKDTSVANWWQDSSSVHRVDDGVAFGSYRLKAVGNGQVPIVAATAFTYLQQKLHEQLNKGDNHL